MKRSQNFNRNCTVGHKEVSREIAIHEAGHAAAIYFGNKQKGFPVVYFNIHINPLNNSFQKPELPEKITDQYTSKIEGGRLIHTLPFSFAEATKNFSATQKHDYERALDADIFNMLIGPLAEAKYVSLRDDEATNLGLVNINSLHFYGGASDLEIINEYLDCYIVSDELRNNKITDLFQAALKFINDQSIWLAITALAEAILADEKNTIEYEDIITALERGRHVVSMHSLNIPNHFHTNPVKQLLIEPETFRPHPIHHYDTEQQGHYLYAEASL